MNETEFEPGGLLGPYSEADVAFCENFAQRYVLGMEPIVNAFQEMSDSCAHATAVLRELRDDYPHLFEDIETFVSGDAMSVSYSDGREERPL